MQAIFDYMLVRMAIVLICWGFVFLANIVDFWAGRSAAKAVGEKVDSKGYRRTFTKVSDYYRVLIFALLFDLIGSLFPFYKVPFGTILGSVAVLAIEGKSVIEKSRKKRSHAADVPEVVKQIIQCSTSSKGKEIIEQLTKQLENKKENK